MLALHRQRHVANAPPATEVRALAQCRLSHASESETRAVAVSNAFELMHRDGCIIDGGAFFSGFRPTSSTWILSRATNAPAGPRVTFVSPRAFRSLQVLSLVALAPPWTSSGDSQVRLERRRRRSPKARRRSSLRPRVRHCPASSLTQDSAMGVEKNFFATGAAFQPSGNRPTLGRRRASNSRTPASARCGVALVGPVPRPDRAAGERRPPNTRGGEPGGNATSRAGRYGARSNLRFVCAPRRAARGGVLRSPPRAGRGRHTPP